MSKKLSAQFENNRQNIRKITTALFISKGIAATSIADIAKEAKLSKGTVSYYYPSKEHLVFEATEYHLADVTDSLLGWIEKTEQGVSLENALLSLFGSVFNTAEKCRMHICLAYEAIMGNEAISRMMADKRAGWQTMVEAGLLKAGYGDTRLVTNAVFLCLDTIILRRALGTLDIDESAICKHIATFVWKE